MPASMSTASAILKRFYTKKISETLNNEALIADLIEESPFPWQGSEIKAPVHLSRNNGISFIAESGSLPAAGSQGYADLTITTSELAARFQVSTRAMKGASSAGPGAFAGILDQEMTRIKDDVKQFNDLAYLFGGRCKGVLNEHISTGNTAGVACTVAAPNGADAVHDYQGDFRPFASVVTANALTWVRVRVFRSDTLAEVVPTGAGAAGGAVFVSAFSTANRTVTLTVVSNVVGAVALDMSAATMGASMDGKGFILAMHPTQFVDSVGANFGTNYDFSLEPRGILGNLFDPNHWGVDRTTATGTATTLQSTLLTSATAGVHALTAISAGRVQAVFDEVRIKCDEDPDTVILSPLQRAAYVAAVAGTTSYFVNQGRPSDLVPQADKIAGIKFKTSQHWPKHAALMLQGKKEIYLARYAAPGFMDEDGEILNRVPGTAAYEGAWQQFDNLFFCAPQRHAVLCGIS